MLNDPHAKALHNTGWYKSEAELVPLFARIPDDVQYLVTHAPPQGILDTRGLGSASLRARLNAITGTDNGTGASTGGAPKSHALRVMQFGHVHTATGTCAIGQTLFVNAAVDDTEQPFVFDIPVDD